ncbi:MAG TPA: sulfotransferase [Bacteroidales bacterium]|nr:sulfotransferase [Bacteroidales bacterium]
MEGKIIGVGFQKTGTSTLREALRMLGYSVKDTTPRALIPILKGNYNKVLSMLDGYDAMEDTPWYMIYKELDNYIPNSKFILTIRDEESWYKSVSKHIGNLKAAHHEWIYGKGKALPSKDKKNAISVYRQHNLEVQEYFRDRPGDLLILDFTNGDQWEKLCEFLDKPMPDKPFPHYNKSIEMLKRQGTPKSRLRFYRHRLKNNLKIFYIKLLGLDHYGK